MNQGLKRESGFQKTKCRSPCKTYISALNILTLMKFIFQISTLNPHRINKCFLLDIFLSPALHRWHSSSTASTNTHNPFIGSDEWLTLETSALLYAIKCNLTELTIKSGCVPLTVCRLLCACTSAFTYVNIPSCLTVFCEALAPVHAVGICAPLHLALFVHAYAPVHAWSEHW